jgi:hypothetical protein
MARDLKKKNFDNLQLALSGLSRGSEVAGQHIEGATRAYQERNRRNQSGLIEAGRSMQGLADQIYKFGEPGRATEARADKARIADEARKHEHDLDKDYQTFLALDPGLLGAREVAARVGATLTDEFDKNRADRAHENVLDLEDKKQLNRQALQEAGQLFEKSLNEARQIGGDPWSDLIVSVMDQAASLAEGMGLTKFDGNDQPILTPYQSLTVKDEKGKGRSLTREEQLRLWARDMAESLTEGLGPYVDLLLSQADVTDEVKQEAFNAIMGTIVGEWERMGLDPDEREAESVPGGGTGGTGGSGDPRVRAAQGGEVQATVAIGRTVSEASSGRSPLASAAVAMVGGVNVARVLSAEATRHRTEAISRGLSDVSDWMRTTLAPMRPRGGTEFVESRSQPRGRDESSDDDTASATSVTPLPALSRADGGGVQEGPRRSEDTVSDDTLNQQMVAAFVSSGQEDGVHPSSPEGRLWASISQEMLYSPNAEDFARMARSIQDLR